MKFWKQALLLNVWLTILLGLIYPAAMTGVAQLIFPHRANGSLLRRGDDVIGSEFIGQKFSGEKYFHGRPSAAGVGYDALASGGSNLGPTSKALSDRVASDVARERENAKTQRLVPVDLVTASGSGLDPDISPAAALWQVPRVAKARGIAESLVRDRVIAHITGRTFGVLGEPRVNVLRLNLALDEEAR